MLVTLEGILMTSQSMRLEFSFNFPNLLATLDHLFGSKFSFICMILAGSIIPEQDAATLLDVSTISK